MLEDPAVRPPPPSATPSSGRLSRLYTTKDVCRIFNRKPRTIRAWCKDGHLTPLRVGGSVFFTEQVIREAMSLDGHPNDES